MYDVTQLEMMQREVTNAFGKFTYTPTRLEQFVEELAKEWDVAIYELNPLFRIPTGLHLERNKISYNDDTNVHYIRLHSPILTSRLNQQAKHFIMYEPNEHKSIVKDIPKHVVSLLSGLYAEKTFGECADLEYGRNKLNVRIAQNGVVHVDVYSAAPSEVLYTLARCTDAGLKKIPYVETIASICFAESAERTGNKLMPNSEGDINNAFTFVRTYFSNK